MPPTITPPVDRADGTGADATIAGAESGQAQVLYYSLANIGGADYEDTTSITVPSVLRLGSGAVAINATPGRYRGFVAFNNASKLSEPFVFDVTGTPPTLTVADNEDGTGAVVTIAGAQAALTQTVYIVPLAGTPQTNQSRTGSGTITLALATGRYAIVGLLDGGLYTIGPYIFDVTPLPAAVVSISGGYCTSAEVASILSQFAIDVRTDDEHDEDYLAADDLARQEEALERGSAWIDMFLQARYDAATLVGNRWVKWATAHLVACELERRRGNGVAASLAAATETYVAMLEAIAKGARHLAGPGGPEPERGDAMPGWSNVTPDLRYLWSSIRRVDQTSAKTPLPPNNAPDPNSGVW